MARLVLSELRRRFLDDAEPLPADVEAALREDDRSGARALLEAIERRRRENRAEGQRLRAMLRYERDLWKDGCELVCGLDEAGMSPLAGPVSAAAVVLPIDCRIPGVDDSKKLSPKEREELAPIIRASCIAWGVAFVEADEIDRLNIYWAGRLAMKRALCALPVTPGHLLIDGNARLKNIETPQLPIVKGDAKSLSIAAASILAKTTRDRHMQKLDAKYPGYGFAQHKGYPVREHVEALERLGACPIHRRSFEPVRHVLERGSQQTLAL